MTSEPDKAAELFETARPRLWGLAYRMLGSAADADDAVQDTYLRWQAADRGTIEVPAAWLTTACTRRCIDLLRAAHRSRVDYVGPWLPEPLVAAEGQMPSDHVEMASTLSTAFLLLLERLTPSERAAYLLHEVFDYDYGDVAAALDKSEAACRQLVSRARRHVGGAKARFAPQPARQDHLLREFLGALRSGTVERLETLLVQDVAMWADGGGKVPTVLNVVEGAENVASLLAGLWRKWWHHYEFVAVEVNGAAGLLVRDAGTLNGVLSLSLAPDGRIAGLYLVRNPDKLTKVDWTATPAGG